MWQYLQGKKPNNLKLLKLDVMKKINRISLAVIGSTSSGKTYLLSDLMVALSKLDYNCVGSMASLYNNPIDFLQALEDDGEVRQTKVEKCRKYSEYRSEFVDGKTNRNFNLGFLDIPGELFTPERMSRFTRIITGLFNLGKYFEYDCYTRGKETRKVLKFVGPDGNGFKETPSFNALMQSYEACEYSLKNDGFKFLRKVSGKDVVKNFFDYDPDSVIEAIAQAIPLLEADIKVKQSEFINDDVGKDIFYFFYVLYATDVVLCDKLVMPSDVSDETVVTNSPSPILQLQKLYNYKEFKANKKRFYMAFRGVDALLEDKFYDIRERGMSVDDLYALVVYLLEYRLTGRNCVDDKEAELGNTVCSYVDTTSVRDCAERHLRDDYALQPYYNQYNPMDEGLLSGEDLNRALLRRINTAVEDFVQIRGHHPEDDNVFMACNVFLTTSAVENENNGYKVTGNDPHNVRMMSGGAKHPRNRACFGTMQLCKSLLHRSGVRFDHECVISLVNRYIF